MGVRGFGGGRGRRGHVRSGWDGPAAPYLVTRIAATLKSQIASNCNRNLKKSLQLRKHPLRPTLCTRDPPVSCGFFIVLHKHLEIIQKMLRLQGCDSESLRFLWPNAMFVIVTLRFYCDFCGKSDFEVVIAYR